MDAHILTKRTTPTSRTICITLIKQWVKKTEVYKSKYVTIEEVKANNLTVKTNVINNNELI
jgi:hypothetical protein